MRPVTRAIVCIVRGGRLVKQLVGRKEPLFHKSLHIPKDPSVLSQGVPLFYVGSAGLDYLFPSPVGLRAPRVHGRRRGAGDAEFKREAVEADDGVHRLLDEVTPDGCGDLREVVKEPQTESSQDVDVLRHTGQRLVLPPCVLCCVPLAAAVQLLEPREGLQVLPHQDVRVVPLNLRLPRVPSDLGLEVLGEGDVELPKDETVLVHDKGAQGPHLLALVLRQREVREVPGQRHPGLDGTRVHKAAVNLVVEEGALQAAKLVVAEIVPREFGGGAGGGGRGDELGSAHRVEHRVDKVRQDLVDSAVVAVQAHNVDMLVWKLEGAVLELVEKLSDLGLPL